MITNFKKFESINEKSIEIGDFVICEEVDYADINTIFTSTNIGKFIRYDDGEAYPYIIKYDYTPKNMKSYFSGDDERNMSIDEIKYWSKNRNELEIILQTNKFNI